MVTIRRLNCFDASKVKKMISYLGLDDSEKHIKAIMGNSCAIMHAIIPLKYKFLPESFILLEDNEILGLISVEPARGRPQKINITRLIFHENFYDAGKQLVDFVIARFGALGATTFQVLVDQSHNELGDLFLNGCGFRQCSYENLWKIENLMIDDTFCASFRHFQNSDAKAVSRLFNSELKSHFRPTLDRVKEEYREPIFAGLSVYKNRYVLEEPTKHRIIAYMSITSNDNTNYIVDININNGYEIAYDEILNFGFSEIKKRKSQFNVYLKHKQYMKTADDLEKYLHKKNCYCIQTLCVLVKDFYKPIKQTESAFQIFLFGDNSKIMTN